MVINMRYLLFSLFFFYSHIVLSDTPPPPFVDSGCSAVCSNDNQNCVSYASERGFFPPGSYPGGNPNYGYLCGTPPKCTAPLTFKNGYCACPINTSWSNTHNTCIPNSCPQGQVVNVVIVNGVSSASCIPDTGGQICNESEKVYDPVSGTLVCPGSGDGSGSSSSQTCVVPGDFNGDCVPDDQQNSSAATTSSPASAAASQSNSSTPSTGGGDDSGNPSTGGGNGGGGGNSGGSGSAAASSSGANSSWTPNSGYGNWIPVDANSNCPNKYKDSAGQWWCSGATNQGSAGSASGACDPTSTNYWSCINSGSAGSAGSSGAASSDDSENKLSDKSDELIEGLTEDIDSELTDFEDAYTDDIDAFKRDGVPFDNEPSAIKSLLISFLPVSTPCNPPSLNFFGRNYELECHYFNIFKQAFGWFLAILTAYQIWQLAIRPVER